MNLNDPALDQPQEVTFDAEAEEPRVRLANHDIHFQADANSDLYDLEWPWADEVYCKSIRMAIHDPYGDELLTLVTRYFPGYQETILGNEGMIISKRLTAPLGSHYDRSAIWTLECQAEGDRLFRLDIEIDWGEPLTQRIVDGLLVAQRNPRRAQGIYKQRNADRTCVFGNPQGRPSAYTFDDDGHATLTYFVLVNGIVDVPLALTISDVGEQVAWNGFLALRDADREFEDSAARWDQAVKTGRLWTSNPRLNWAVQSGRLEWLRSVQRMRTGFAPTSRRIADFPAAVDCADAVDVTLSRNLLAHLRRLAERSDGRLPVAAPVHPKDPIESPGSRILETNGAYLHALNRHLMRHPDDELLQSHRAAFTLCAESLVRYDWKTHSGSVDNVRGEVAHTLATAASLAERAEDGANAARWASESEALGKSEQPMADSHSNQLSSRLFTLYKQSEFLCSEDKLCRFVHPDLGIALAGLAVWSVSGLKWYDDSLWVYPNRTRELDWWALVDLPLQSDVITLVWDGYTLYTTRKVRSDQPVKVVDRIRVNGTAEHSFDLHFDMIQLTDSEVVGRQPHEDIVFRFRPDFDRDADE